MTTKPLPNWAGVGADMKMRLLKLEHPSVGIETLTPESEATVSVDLDEDKKLRWSFGIPQGLQGIQGEKGDKGDTGERGEKGDGLVISGQYESYDALIAAHPIGAKGDTWQVTDTMDVWGWDIDKQIWVNLGQLKGNKGDSANDVPMSPDPEEYFRSIYGETSGDIIGSLSVAEPPFEDDPTEVFNSALNS